jgi:hypothetical protein
VKRAKKNNPKPNAIVKPQSYHIRNCAVLYRQYNQSKVKRENKQTNNRKKERKNLRSKHERLNWRVEILDDFRKGTSELETNRENTMRKINTITIQNCVSNSQ